MCLALLDANPPGEPPARAMRCALMCNDLLPLLDSFLDRELPAAERLGVEAQLARCPDLASAYAHEAAVLDGIRRHLRAVEPPARLYRRIAAMLAAAQAE